MSDSPYDADFYRGQAAGSYLSAKKLLPLVLDLVPARSVLDIGCGVGTFLRAFIELGVTDVIGIDGIYVNLDNLQIPRASFRPVNLSDGFDLGRTFDLAICLEVAEHLSGEAAESFIGSITRHSGAVLFSAAIPLQGGVGHVNEQWPSYWAKIFERSGYRVYDPFRRVIWSDDGLEVWYRQNTLLFARDDAVETFPTLAALTPADPTEIDIVHPRLYDKRATQLEQLQSYLRSSNLVEVSLGENGTVKLKRRG